MEIIAAIIGAVTTLVTTCIVIKKKDKNKKLKQHDFIEKFVQDLNIKDSNVYILNVSKSEIEKPFKFDSKANLNKDKILIILK